MIYCEICGTWLKLATFLEAESQHYHRGIERGMMRAEPINYRCFDAHLGIKPVYNYIKWRAVCIEIETGYSETPSWGHEAGGWIHYTYHAYKDEAGDFTEAKTRKELIDKLIHQEGVTEDRYFGIMSKDWKERFPLRQNAPLDNHKHTG